jgi:hypothetical protein
LSTIEPDALAGVPTVYRVPAASVSATVSVASTSASSAGVTFTVADETPAARVSVLPSAESVPPVTETV